MSIVSNVENWYAVHTRSNFETRVSIELTAKGIYNYFPHFEQLRQWKDRRRRIDVPLFPGYLFARFIPTPENRLKVAKNTGVARIVGTAGNIEAIPEQEVLAVRIALCSRLQIQPHPFLTEGDWVRVRRGILKDVEGHLVRYKNKASVVICVPALGQAISVEVDIQDIERVWRPTFLPGPKSKCA